MLEFRELEAKEEAEMDYLLTMNAAIFKLRVIRGKCNDIEVTDKSNKAIQLIEESTPLLAVELVETLKTAMAVRKSDIDLRKFVDGIIRDLQHANDVSTAYQELIEEGHSE